MFKLIFTLGMALHFLGDFYVSPGDAMAEHAFPFRNTARRGISYAIVVFAGLSLFFSAWAMLFAAALTLGHLGIDVAMGGYIQRRGGLSESAFFGRDQCLHIAFVAAVSLFSAFSGHTLSLLPQIRALLSAAAEDPRPILNWACLLLAVWKPANTAVRHLLFRYRPAQEEEGTVPNAGAWIGTLERIIMALLLSVHQYSAMGLVLTAKSIARFDKISRDQKFAEYYLLGTLLSTLFVILSYFLFL
ncbi:DUF3307 domain-containing protein [Papillibacter cinnamivorans]|uniref:DUF3307 domain-containing protein n=1 Tax=Papillibacter cinnamivorans DSM 12816 TaxID=1122930 RepID=A0A1W2C434_9FIRM|nr:DUF3307 domain-containing protein [Papillibacter cinnamivorans]SMC79861.1 Protein of unknown function [Papillibacter cinnamivorans DSM 12816]